MTQHHHSKVLVMGSGPAGNTAALYAARAGLSPILIHGLQPGGQLTITTDVENYPGFADVVQGPWLMQQMEEQARRAGTTFHNDIIVDINFSQRPFMCTGDSGAIYTGDTVIICTGATAKWLGLKSEQALQGFGVSACATCDGFFYRGKEVVVVGGGNTAVEEAIYLANMCKKVTLIHRRNKLRADKVLQDRLLRHNKIEVAWNKETLDILGCAGPDGVTGVRVRDTVTGEESDIPCAGFFVAIGHTPTTRLFNGILDMDDTGYIITKTDSTATNIPGVFAAGDVQDHIYRQAITAAGTGCMAALEADRYLSA